MKKYDFTVVGTAATVSVLRVDRMPQSGKSTPAFGADFTSFSYGGKGFNIVAGHARLGCGVYPVLTYCDDRMRPELHRYLRSAGLPEDGIKDPPAGAVGTTLMIQDREKNHMTLITGYDLRLPENGYFGTQEMKPSFFRNSAMAVLTAPLPANTIPAIRAIRSSGIPMALSMCIDENAFPRETLAEALNNTRILFANEGEIAYIRGMFGMKSITELFENGMTRCIVETLGAAGSRVYAWSPEGIKTVTVPAVPPKTREVETVGAGDGYVCGFLYGLRKGKSMADCAMLGGCLSSFVLEKEGSVSNLPTEEQLLERFKGAI